MTTLSLSVSSCLVSWGVFGNRVDACERVQESGMRPGEAGKLYPAGGGKESYAAGPKLERLQLQLLRKTIGSAPVLSLVPLVM